MIELKADLHCHTTFSDGWGTPEEYVEQARMSGLDALAITDHRTAEGGLRYWKEQPANGLIVVPGEEILTDAGHLLVYFVKSTIEDCSLEEAVAKAREQGALVYGAHLYHLSFRRFIWGESRQTFLPQELSLFDGIESCNGQTASRCNRRMAAFAAEHPEMGIIGGSDAHFLWELGGVQTLIRAKTATLDGVREAMAERRTKAIGPTRANRLLWRWIYYAYSVYRKVQGEGRRTHARRGKRRRCRRLS